MRVFAPDGKPFRSYLELVDDLEAERRRAEIMAAKLRELGIDPDRI